MILHTNSNSGGVYNTPPRFSKSPGFNSYYKTLHYISWISTHTLGELSFANISDVFEWMRYGKGYFEKRYPDNIYREIPFMINRTCLKGVPLRQLSVRDGISLRSLSSGNKFSYTDKCPTFIDEME